VLMSVNASGVAGASVGDSEAWLIRADVCDSLTEHQHRKPLLGDGAAEPVAIEARHEGATLLVGTDGLFKYASRDRIHAVALQEQSQVVAQLVDAARLPTGGLQDDIAIVLCRAGPMIRAHACGIRHRDEIIRSERCGCFYCKAIF